MGAIDPQEMLNLALQIKQWGKALGFADIGIADTDLRLAEEHLQTWLAKGFHGEMTYMQRHGLKRSRPALLHEGTVRVISVRMDYLPEPAAAMGQALAEPTSAYISRYALGRD
jgi:epoxyqueuosine reductase